MTSAALESAHLKERIASELNAARERTLRLLEPLSDDELRAQHSPPEAADRRRADPSDERRRLRRVRTST